MINYETFIVLHMYLEIFDDDRCKTKHYKLPSTFQDNTDVCNPIVNIGLTNMALFILSSGICFWAKQYAYCVNNTAI